MPSHEMKYTTFLIVNDDETSGESQSGIHSNVAVTVIEPSVQSLVCENQLVSVMVNPTDSSTSQGTTNIIGNGGDSVPGCSGVSGVPNSPPHDIATHRSSKPVQPVLVSFPKTVYGKVSRSFQARLTIN